MKCKLLFYCVLILFCQCCKSISVKPTELKFDGLILNPNYTYENYMGQHGVPNEQINLGVYQYTGDTLNLRTNVELYVSKLTQPKLYNCEDNLVKIRFKEYIYENERPNMNMNWIHLKLKALNSEKDTIAIWKPDMNNNNNLYEVTFKKSELAGFEEIWLEFWNEPTTKPIKLPKEFSCMEIAIPMISTLNNPQLTKKLSWGMDELIIKRRNKTVIIESPKRNKKYKLKTASNKRG